MQYLQIVVDDLKIGELGKRVVRRQWPLHHELDLPRVSLETVSDLKTDSPHDYVHQVLNLRMRGCKFELKYGTYPGRRKVPLHSFISHIHSSDRRTKGQSFKTTMESQARRIIKWERTTRRSLQS